MVSTFEFAENVVGVMIDSDIDDDIMKELISIVSEKIEEHGQINLFCELKKGTD